MVKILTEERKGELKTREDELKKIDVGITNFSSFVDMVKGQLIGLDTAVRHEQEEVSRLLKEIRDLRELPAMKGDKWKSDPWREIAENYRVSIERLMKAGAFKSWMVRFQELRGEKFISLLNKQKDEFTKYQELIVKKDIFDKFTESLQKQVTLERQMYHSTLFIMINELKQKINEIAKEVGVAEMPIRDIDKIEVIEPDIKNGELKEPKIVHKGEEDLEIKGVEIFR